jgi:hypothetical protein
MKKGGEQGTNRDMGGGGNNILAEKILRLLKTAQSSWEKNTKVDVTEVNSEDRSSLRTWQNSRILWTL